MEQHRCIQAERIRNLETGQAEMRVYVRDIREDIQEIKSSLKEYRPPPSNGVNGNSGESAKVWQPIVIELIKLLGLSITILGAIVGAVKILGK
jgi:hypothetical protein